MTTNAKSRLTRDPLSSGGRDFSNQSAALSGDAKQVLGVSQALAVERTTAGVRHIRSAITTQVAHTNINARSGGEYGRTNGKEFIPAWNRDTTTTEPPDRL